MAGQIRRCARADAKRRKRIRHRGGEPALPDGIGDERLVHNHHQTGPRPARRKARRARQGPGRDRRGVPHEGQDQRRVQGVGDGRPPARRPPRGHLQPEVQQPLPAEVRWRIPKPAGKQRLHQPSRPPEGRRRTRPPRRRGVPYRPCRRRGQDLRLHSLGHGVAPYRQGEQAPGRRPQPPHRAMGQRLHEALPVGKGPLHDLRRHAQPGRDARVLGPSRRGRLGRRHRRAIPLRHAQAVYRAATQGVRRT